jgi:hypothetical protein
LSLSISAALRQCQPVLAFLSLADAGFVKLVQERAEILRGSLRSEALQSI